MIPGYKQTEVGVIPEDWVPVQIEQVADKITVGFVGSMAHLFTKGGVPLLRGQNVSPHKLDLTDTKYISSDTHNQWKKSALQAGDVVMVRVGYPGTSCVIPENLGPANAASLVVVRPSTEKLDPDFLCYVINSDFGRHQIESYLVGGAQQVLNTNTAAIFKLPLTRKIEQEAIAEALSDADTLIESLEQLIAKKRHLKRGAMQELLTGRTRLPGFSGEWARPAFGEMAKIRNEKINTRGAPVAEFCIELEQVGQNTGQVESFTDARSRDASKYLFRSGDALFGRLRPYLRKFWLADRDGVCSTEIWPLMPSGGALLGGFLYQVVQTEAFVE